MEELQSESALPPQADTSVLYIVLQTIATRCSQIYSFIMEEHG